MDIYVKIIIRGEGLPQTNFLTRIIKLAFLCIYSIS